MFSSLSIKSRLILLVVMALIFLSSMVLYSRVLIAEEILEARRGKVVAALELGFSTMQHFEQLAKSGKMTQDDAKKAALQTLSSMRYDGDNYFSVYDANYRIVMHPKMPELNGKDMSQFTDPTGTKIVVEFTDIANRKQGEFLYYQWSENNELLDKVGTARIFEPWGFVIQAALYIHDVDERVLSVTKLMYLVLFFAAIVLAVVSYLVANSVVRPVLQLTQQISDASRHNDLSGNISIADKAEIGVIAESFNQLAKRMSDAIRSISENARFVFDTSDGLRKTMEQVEVAVGERHREMVDAGQLVAQISSSQDMSASQLNSLQGLSRESQDSVQASVGIVARSAAEIESISSEVSQTVQTITQLGEESHHISEIVDAIRDIADQTNLLALNAAIEAARAGEQGRGFAVVADEVRKLAERTASSTSEISNLLSSIQAGTSQAVTQIHAVSDQAEKGVAISRETSDAMQTIYDNIGKVTALAVKTSDDSHEQQKATQQINHVMAGMVVESEKNRDAAHHVACVARQMAESSERLQNELSKFKI